MSEHPVPAAVDRLGRAGLIAGALGALACLAGAATQPDQFFRSYLFGLLFGVGLAVGSLSLLMIQHLTGGLWGLAIRRVLEAAARTLPLLAILFLPVLFGMPRIYPWARPEAAQDPVLQAKAAYLNVPFFAGRAVFYFALWTLFAHLLARWSLERDSRPGDESLGRKMRMLSGPGLVAMGLTLTFASVDWAMSLTPHWLSTVYGVLFMVGHALSALAFAIVVLALCADQEPVQQVATPRTFHDLGKLLFAFVMLWAYIAVSQLIIVWSGNLPEEIPWYLTRLDRGWQWVALLLVLGHFVLPFLLLLSRDIKRRHGMLAWVAGGVVLARLLDLFWLVGPELHGGPGLAVHWLDAAAPLAVGGLWLALFARLLAGRPLLPPGEPELASAGSH